MITKPWLENLLLLAALLIIVAFLPGCTSMLLGNAFDHGQEPTPEEIKAYNEIGFDLHSCLSVSGPPAGGNYVKILTPKARNVTVKFSQNCQILQ